jgi:hypothetical protein
MLILSSTATVLAGAVFAAWLIAAGWALATGLKMRRDAAEAKAGETDALDRNRAGAAADSAP